MLQNTSPNQTVGAAQAPTKEDIANLLTSTNIDHPALSRVRIRLGSLKGIEPGVESRITSYDRMHHRHNRS